MQKECKFGRKEHVGDGEKKAQIQHTFLLRLFTSLPLRELLTASHKLLNTKVWPVVKIIHDTAKKEAPSSLIITNY
jgi:hypothetical protein